MTINELQIQLDLNPDNRVDVLKNIDTCHLTACGYLFVDSEDGQCYLFDKNGNLDDIHKVKHIGYGEFAHCTSLTSIEIPNSVISIGSYVFYYCSFLKDIKIPNSVISIGSYVFYNCSFLKDIKISDSVENIGDSVFEGCISLKSIKIPSSIESIGNWAFGDCKSLKEVVFKGKTIKQVKAMNGYPWGIIDKSIIKVES